MVSTRTQDGTIDTKIYIPEANLLARNTVLRSPRRRSSAVSRPDPALYKRGNRAAAQSNTTIAPLDLAGLDRRPSIVTGKPLSASALRKEEAARRKSLKSVRFDNAQHSAALPTPRSLGLAMDTDDALEDLLGDRPYASFSPLLPFYPTTPLAPSSTPTTPGSATRRSRRLSARNLPTSQDLQNDISSGNTFFPSVIIGARETVGLSKIRRADKVVKQWEQILHEHEQNAPQLAPSVRSSLQTAREARASLDDTLEENHRVGDVNPAESAIKQRLAALEWALETTKFGPEAENIKCAIEGYRSGHIEFSNHFTIIYAAHIVDTAEDYADFVRDRMARLDRYARTYGEGWMWYEPPLNVHPDSQPKALLGVGLARDRDFTNLGGYNVTQGFWKREGYVRRIFNTSVTGLREAENEHQFFRDPQDPTLVYCQNEGKKLAFRSILDSGATYPSLHPEDIQALDIDSNWYAAQSVASLVTANGRIHLRHYELWVCVLDESGNQLVAENDAMYPGSHKWLGGLCPVSETQQALTYDFEGREIALRLSGMLPFLACYVASCPTRGRMWLGEDRNDVLGHYRMPGQKKWSIEIQTVQPSLGPEYYDDPKITFNHRGGQLIDSDPPDRSHASRLVSLPDSANPAVVDYDPPAWQGFRPAMPPYVPPPNAVPREALNPMRPPPPPAPIPPLAGATPRAGRTPGPITKAGPWGVLPISQDDSLWGEAAPLWTDDNFSGGGSAN